MVPIHLLAFFILYVLSTRLVETEIVSSTSDLARSQLDHESRELMSAAVAHPGDSPDGHFFEELMAAHSDISFQLFLPGGGVIGADPELPPLEHREMVEFLASGQRQQIWLSEEGGRKRMRGLMKVVATEECTPCHQAHTTLALGSMSLDMTELLSAAAGHSRRNLLLLIVLWAAILGATTVVVKRTVRRSAEQLEADLAAAEVGSINSGPGEPGILLDPVAAKLHASLRESLERQRQRQEEVASRLAHTDQLASLGQLAAGLAHEVKNPLAGIQGALEILKEDEKNRSTKELYDEMLGELRRVNDTLQSLLSSARPSAPRLSRTDLRQLLNEIHRLLEPGLRRRNVALKVQLATGDLHALIDAAKIRQVLINLVQNAADAMDGSGTIVLRASGFPEGEGVGTILAVEDDGPGIPTEHQARIFEPFYTTKFSGTGLGLSIARSMVEQHGGSLEFDSEPGTGTTFYLLLPGADPASANAPEAELSKEA
jgi:signal transduction histidine kinase